MLVLVRCDTLALLVIMLVKSFSCTPSANLSEEFVASTLDASFCQEFSLHS